jgi:hypothetical protein
VIVGDHARHYLFVLTQGSSFLWLPGLFGLALCCFSNDVQAQSLEYSAPEGCATEREFVAAIATRGGHFAGVRAEAPGPVLAVSIRDQNGVFQGTFQERRDADPSGVREVHGATCAEVVEALAIVAAIALRPESEPTKEHPAAEAKPESAEPAPRRPPLRATTKNTWPVPFHPGDQAVAVAAGKVRFESVTNITAFAGVTLGAVPRLAMPSIDVTLSRANFVTFPGERSYLVGPVWRLHATLLADVERHFGDLTSNVGGQGLGIGPCYSPLYDAGGLELLFCLELGAQFFGIRTKDAAGKTIQQKSMGKGTLGIGTELTYNLGRHVQIGLKLGADGATNPITAERPDGSQIFSSSVISGYTMLGLGGHF